MQSQSPSFHPEHQNKDRCTPKESSPEMRCCPDQPLPRIASPDTALINATATRRTRLIHYFGTASLECRSPSPTPQQKSVSSYPILPQPRKGRRLPATPNKPSTLHSRPSGYENYILSSAKASTKQPNINFPKLNASPTHSSENEFDYSCSPCFNEPLRPMMSNNSYIFHVDHPRAPSDEPISNKYKHATYRNEAINLEEALMASYRMRHSEINGCKLSDKFLPITVPCSLQERVRLTRSDSDENEWC